ncbi:hypothetical protein [Paenibacillus pasadenensis]|uniref:hypothetical protein n=1 Tax=Paenibacillus pasadenensis TaxID=217090 RepID=UPI000C7E7B32|nr:hypothetical protein [Paenibacillus pasadenensis]
MAEMEKIKRKRAPGAGRKPQGITRKVSLTLTEDEWAQIEALGFSTLSTYIKQQLATSETAPTVPHPSTAHTNFVFPDHNPPADRAARVPVALDRREIAFTLRSAANEAKRAGTPVSDEDVAEAEQRILNMLFPKGSEHAQLAVLHQYICPATGKRYGSAYKMLLALVPQALQWPAYDRARKEASQARQSKGPLYFDQIR